MTSPLPTLLLLNILTWFSAPTLTPSAPAARRHCCRHRHPDRCAASACPPEKPAPPARGLHSSDRWPMPRAHACFGSTKYAGKICADVASVCKCHPEREAPASFRIGFRTTLTSKWGVVPTQQPGHSAAKPLKACKYRATVNAIQPDRSLHKCQRPKGISFPSEILAPKAVLYIGSVGICGINLNQALKIAN